MIRDEEHTDQMEMEKNADIIEMRRMGAMNERSRKIKGGRMGKEGREKKQ